MTRSRYRGDSGFNARGVSGLVPVQGSAYLVVDNAGFEEVLLFLQIQHFAHPGERILNTRELLGQANLLAAAIGNKLEIVAEHLYVQAKYSTRHRVLRVAILQLHTFLDQVDDFLLKFRRPQMRIFDLDLVDQVDSEV